MYSIKRPKGKRKTQEFNCSITANISTQEAFEYISKVSEWWVEEVEGKAEKLNDEFTVHSGTTWNSFKITELIPNKK